MPSPFPGMDPYIEDSFFWSDFHASMMGAFRGALNAALPDRYTASIERNVWVQETVSRDTTLVGVPDVQVADQAPGTVASGGSATTSAAVTAPQTVTFSLVRRPVSGHLRILDRRRRQVVTVIELLSPANKTTTGYGIIYRQKRLDVLAGGVNLVEIDLLRAGTRPPVQEPPLTPSDYCILVCPAASFPQAGYWPLSVRDALPIVPIPLAPEEVPSSLNLRDCLDQVYEAGRYERELDYSEVPTPPLREPDDSWARQLLTAYLAQRK
jgi:hypothetical protein